MRPRRKGHLSPSFCRLSSPQLCPQHGREKDHSMHKWQSHSDPTGKRQEREKEASVSRGQEALAGCVTSPALGKAGGNGQVCVGPRVCAPCDGSRVKLLPSPGAAHVTPSQPRGCWLCAAAQHGRCGPGGLGGLSSAWGLAAGRPPHHRSFLLLSHEGWQFSVRGQALSVFSFSAQRVSVAAAQLCWGRI